MRAARFALFVVTLVVAKGSAFAHGDVMRIGSTAAGGGQLVAEPEFVFGGDVFYMPFVSELGALRLYSDIIPSFAWILEEGDGIHPLNDEVEVEFTIAAPISAGASVRVGGRTLDAPGEAASLGPFVNDPEAHVHPEWRLLLAEGVAGQFEVSFRLSADGFTDSPVYTVLITNEEPAATPTATGDATPAPTSDVTSTPTATSEPTAEMTATSAPTDTTPTQTTPAPVCPGDCDGNGAVTIAELVRAVGLALNGGTSTCTAADGNGDGTIAINELIRAVRSALDGCGA